jgi:hypothetical protein
MTWTIDQKTEQLLQLPWTVVPVVTEDGDRLLRVAEIPSAVGHGATSSELEADLWDSLRESLRAYLHFGDPIPLPQGVRLPWSPGARKHLEAREITVIVRRRRQAWGDDPEVEVDATSAAAAWANVQPSEA